ncbi:TonB-dependent receptor [Chitinophaga sp. 212800010-3]|uniref:SusC/RagA family TonB-linked outer membrane protein n=1 Tax=unclassified Chitinophaga TaxID=2619133 RepID=UPI002E1119B5
MMFRKQLLPLAIRHCYALLLMCLIPLMAARAQQPAPAVKGVIHDEKGAALPGVNVVATDPEKKTKTGTVSDEHGMFSFQRLPKGKYIFTFSLIGYEKKEYSGYDIAADSHVTLAVKMKQEDKILSQVIVVGYGTKKKEDITGAVSQAGKEVFENRPITNVAQGLQGVIPNLNITFADGRADRGGSFNLRGFTSINGGGPLILIDGVEGDINLINPEDVESVSVLKDAASSAIYGARAAFGVILVTTKKGAKGKVNIHYSNSFGYSSPLGLPHVINDPLAAATLQNEAYKGYAGIDNTDMLTVIAYLKQRQADPSLPELGVNTSNNTWIRGGNTDWYKAFYNDKQPFSKNFLSISGGTDKVSYYLSGGIQSQDGTFRVATDKYNRYNFRSRLDLQAFDWLKIYTNSEYDQGKYNAPNKFVNGDFNAYRYLSLFANPYEVIKTPSGNWTQAGMLTFGSLQDGGREIQTRQLFRNTVGFKTSFFDNSLHINGDGTMVWNQSRDDRKARQLKYEDKPGHVANYSNKDFYQTSTDENVYSVINLYAEYEKSFGKHNVDALVGFNQEQNRYRQYYAYAENNLSDNYGSLNLTSGQMKVGDNNSDWALRGMFYRLSYNYNRRYFIEANGRYDGTSRFPSSKRYGFFPSVSAGWLMSEESFFSGLKPAINSFKLRASYGSLGNQQVGNYAYFSTMTVAPITAIIDGTKPPGTFAPGLVARSLTWETARTLDFGADIGLLNNRLEVGADWYNRQTINMLTKSKSLPAVLGTTEPSTNAADLSTKGWELSLKWKDDFKLGGKPFGYNVSVVLSDYRTTITRYDNPNQYLGDYYKGQVLGGIWGYITEGFFQTDDEYLKHADQQKVSAIPYKVNGHPMAGDIKFKDVNGDGVIYNGKYTLADHGDMVLIGNTTPRYSYGVNLGANWRNIDVNVFFQGIGKKDFYPRGESGVFWGFYNRWNQPVYDHIQNNYWTPTHTDAYFPRPRAYEAFASGDALNLPQTRYLQNAAYLRLKNLSIGYTVPDVLVKKLHLNRVRVYFSGQNLFTWTKLSKAFDPETIGDEPDASSNGAGFVYPMQRTFTAGLDLNF